MSCVNVGSLHGEPQKALCGGIPSPVLEPFPRSWSHFVANCCQKLTNLVKIDFEIPPRRALRGLSPPSAKATSPSPRGLPSRSCYRGTSLIDVPP